MQSKLNLADLTVTSFATEAADPSVSANLYQYPVPFTDPTAETRCFYCPIDYSYGGCI